MDVLSVPDKGTKEVLQQNVFLLLAQTHTKQKMTKSSNTNREKSDFYLHKSFWLQVTNESTKTYFKLYI